MKKLFILVSVLASAYLLSQLIWGKQATIETFINAKPLAVKGSASTNSINSDENFIDAQAGKTSPINDQQEDLISSTNANDDIRGNTPTITQLMIEIEQIKISYAAQQLASNAKIDELQTQINALHANFQKNTDFAQVKDEPQFAMNELASPTQLNPANTQLRQQSNTNEIYNNNDYSEDESVKRMNQTAILRDVSRKMELAALASLSQ